MQVTRGGGSTPDANEYVYVYGRSIVCCCGLLHTSTIQGDEKEIKTTHCVEQHSVWRMLFTRYESQRSTDRLQAQPMCIDVTTAINSPVRFFHRWELYIYNQHTLHIPHICHRHILPVLHTHCCKMLHHKMHTMAPHGRRRNAGAHASGRAGQHFDEISCSCSIRHWSLR